MAQNFQRRRMQIEKASQAITSGLRCEYMTAKGHFITADFGVPERLNIKLKLRRFIWISSIGKVKNSRKKGCQKKWKNNDGSIINHFGGDPKHSNFLATVPEWNYIVRLYKPKKEILDGSWTFPKAKSVEWSARVIHYLQEHGHELCRL